MSNKWKKLFKRSVWTMLAIFFALIFTITMVVSGIASQYSTWVDQFFNSKRYKLIMDEEADPNQDTQYFKSDYALRDENGNLDLAERNGVKRQQYDKEALFAHSMDVCERVDEEGSVLLWNKNNALPLAAGAKVSNFGVGNLYWEYHGGGSGYVDIGGDPSIKDALESRGFAVNNDMLTLTRALRAGYGYGSDLAKDIPWDRLNSSSRGSVEKVVGDYGDAAIYTIQRAMTEGRDATARIDYSEDKSLISFTTNECSVIEGLSELKKSGKIKKIILVLNSANPLSLKHIQKYDIDACLWVGYGGSASCTAVADLLAGNANPSGHFTDTWVYDAYSAPANENFGDFTFGESSGLPANMVMGQEKNDKYIVYQEGIYVGYRYYETRYEDLVIGGRNADSSEGVKAGSGKWNYSDEVAYSFGYGESYTTFEYSGFDVKKKGDNFEVSMTIKNTGPVAGKEVMQVYLQKPYTDYDRENKIEKSAVELVGFAKTKLLEPNEPQTLTVTIPEYEFKTYDTFGAGTYILEKGSYYLAAGTDAHDALNNILAEKGYTKANGMDADGNKAFAEEVKISKNDFEKYSVSEYTNNKIENRFKDADINLYEGTAGQSITYLSRSDWGATYPKGAVSLNCTSERFIKDMQYAKEVANNPEDEMPIYNTVTSEMGKLSLIQLRGLPYDDPLWEDLLNQMTFDEQQELIRTSMGSATSVSAPGGGATDGPCGTKDGKANEHTAFPCNPITASTFNKELVEELGEALGMEILNLWGTGIFGVGANIHRSAFAGRVWEYYSEDAYLTAVMNTVESKGLRAMGVILFTKHFALNEQETNRHGVSTWANEQTIREIYLKAFETAITDGNCNGLMTSFNRIGANWSGTHSGLLTDVLRGEWGFTGYCTSDSGGVPYMGTNELTSIFAAGIIAGQDCWLGGVSEGVLADYKTNATVCQALREVAHRKLYTKLYSNAMNGMTSNTRVENVTPGWEKVILAAEIISGIGAAACVGMAVAAWVLWYKNEYKYE